MKKYVKASISWSSFNNPVADKMNDVYLPSSGQGDTKASQIATCVNKLVYRWFNDGDVYDNVNLNLQGWANNLSSYANWLYSNVKETKGILQNSFSVRNEDDYTNVLYDLYETTLCNEDLMNKYAKQPASGDVYDCSGPFEWVDDYEEDEWDEDEDEW